MGPFSQPQWSSWAYSAMSDPFPSHTQFSNYPAYLADSLEAYQTHHDRLVQQQQMSRATESKPRLSKEEVEILESEFQKNHKPSSTTKKSLAETMRVDNARINVCNFALSLMNSEFSFKFLCLGKVSHTDSMVRIGSKTGVPARRRRTTSASTKQSSDWRRSASKPESVPSPRKVVRLSWWPRVRLSLSPVP